MRPRAYPVRVVVGCLWSLWVAAASLAAEGGAAEGSISGRVVSSTGKPASDAVLTVVELRRRVATDAEGVYRFEAVPPGRYRVQAVSTRYGRGLAEVTVEPGTAVDLTIDLDLEVHAEHLTVTAGPGMRGLSDVAQAAAVLEGLDLERRLEPTLGETLSKEAGVSSTYFGPGASRPVIRGLGGDRIRILEDGVGTGDASSVSPDHAVSSDPLGAERIEIVRGPATLLYGSNAVGGVVNVIGNEIPDHRVDAPIGGTLDLAAGSVSDERRGSVSLTGGAKHFGWQASWLDRDAQDYAIPGGTLDNSDIESRQGSLGASYLGEHGHLGVSARSFDSRYGIPGEEPIQIDMEQERYDLRAERRFAKGPFERASVRAGQTDYEHVEIEDTGELGTLFTNDYREGRVEATHRPVGPLAGTIGVQVSTRDFEAIGEEAIVPPTTTDQAALFLFEEAGPDDLRCSFGARFESHDIAVSGPQDDRSFDTLSGSVGLVWKAAERYAIAVSVASTGRPPTAEELFTDGAHPAAGRFEIGDPALEEESTVGYNLGLRKTAGILSGELDLFQYDFDDYIFPKPTGQVDADSGLDVFAYEQHDARFTGAEAHLDIELYHAEPHHVQLELMADTVEAELTANDEPLPNIPPARVGLALAYQGASFWARIEGRHAADQDDTSPFESPTDGYTMVNASAGYRFFGHGLVHDVILRGTNLGDELARNHVSPLKDMAPLPGRDVSLVYRLTF